MWSTKQLVTRSWLSFQAPSWPFLPHIDSYSLTTLSRHHSVHLREDCFCGFCVTYTNLDFFFFALYIQIFPPGYFRMLVRGSNKINSRQNTAAFTSFGMCLSTDGFHALRPRKHNVTYVFPENFGFWPIKWIDNLQKALPTLSPWLKFILRENLLSLLILGSIELRDNIIQWVSSAADFFLMNRLRQPQGLAFSLTVVMELILSYSPSLVELQGSEKSIIKSLSATNLLCGSENRYASRV